MHRASIFLSGGVIRGALPFVICASWKIARLYTGVE
jgi:hypothetical protein